MIILYACMLNLGIFFWITGSPSMRIYVISLRLKISYIYGERALRSRAVSCLRYNFRHEKDVLVAWSWKMWHTHWEGKREWTDKCRTSCVLDRAMNLIDSLVVFLEVNVMRHQFRSLLTTHVWELQFKHRNFVRNKNICPTVI